MGNINGRETGDNFRYEIDGEYEQSPKVGEHKRSPENLWRIRTVARPVLVLDQKSVENTNRRETTGVIYLFLKIKIGREYEELRKSVLMSVRRRTELFERNGFLLWASGPYCT